MQLSSQPGAKFVRRRPGEAFHPDCIVPTVKHGGGSIMVWGCMSAAGTGDVYLCEGRMNSIKYSAMLDEVLESSIYKLFDEEEPEYIFQQDNAPCHTSRKMLEWFEENGISVLEWPPQSPDLSPIEHLWQVLKSELSKYRYASKNILRRKITEEWEKITPDVCYNLVASMPKRINAVIRARGGSTKY